MGIKELQKLNIGDVIQHKHLGKCRIQRFIPGFGPVILPIYFRQRVKLSQKTGMHFNTPLLETSLRLILKKAE